MCNPADDEPCISGTPSQAAIQGDTRSPGNATTTPCSPPPARCWPPASSVSTTGCPPASSSPPRCRNWRPAPGAALTGGGTLLPMSRCDPARPPTPITTWPSSTTAKPWRSITPNASPHPRNELCCTPRIAAVLPRLHRPRLPVRGPPLRPLRHQPRHRRQRPDLCLLPQPQTRRTRLDHPQKQPQPNRMDPTRTPRPRTTPRQHVPPPRETATGQ